MVDLSISIKDAIPHIFEREKYAIEKVTSGEKSCQLLAQSLKYYVDGVIVTENDAPIGIYGSHHVLKDVLENPKNTCKTSAHDIMEPLEKKFSENSQISDICSYFATKVVGFAPITDDMGKLTAVVATRDLLPIISKMELDFPAFSLASNLIHVSENISVGTALRIMFNKQIRRIGVENESDEMDLVDDRVILDYVNHLKNLTPDVMDIPIGKLQKVPVTQITPTTTISEAAELLFTTSPACALLGQKIITPKDLCKKTLYAQVLF